MVFKTEQVMAHSDFHSEDLESTLSHILSHKIFASSARAIAFLKYITTETIENRADEINGTTIAQDVFGKGAEFNQVQDSTVRVYARRLRAMLEEYYLEHPARDPLIISIPKGGYKPLIEKNDAYYALKDTQDSASPEPHASGMLVTFPKWIAYSAALTLLCGGLIFGTPLSGHFFSSESAAPALSSAPKAPNPPSTSYPKIAVSTFVNETGIEDYDFLEKALQERLVQDLSRFKLTRPSIYEGRYEAALSEGPDKHDYAIFGMIISVEPTLDLYIKLTNIKDPALFFEHRVQRVNNNPDYFHSLSKIVSELSGDFAGLDGVIVKARLDNIQEQINQDTLIVSNLQAFECYALLRPLLENPNPEIYERIYSCLNTLLETDPNNATLLSTFGWITYLGATSHEPILMARSVNPDINEDEGIAMMIRAVEIDPNNAETHQNLSAYKSIAGDVQGALQHAEMAAILNPGNPDNLAWLGRCLITVNQWDRALIYAQEALDRNSNPSAEYYRPFFYFALHKSDPKGMQEAADNLVASKDYYADIFSALAAAANDDEATLERLRPKIQVMAARNNNDIMRIMRAIMQSESLNMKVRKLFIKGGIIAPQGPENIDHRE